MRNNRNFFLVTIFILNGLLAGCGEAGKFTDNPDVIDPPTSGKLTYYKSCDDLLTDIQNALLAQAEATLDSYQCGAEDELYAGGEDVGAVDVAAESDGNATADYTGTNLQEQGVDEADIIKTDGTYLYAATAEGVDVFKAWPVSEFAKIATIGTDAVPTALYLTEARLIVITSMSGNTDGSVAIGMAWDAVDTSLGNTLSQQMTEILFYDVSDPALPTVIKEKNIQGEYVNSRLVDGLIHVVVNAGSPQYSIVYPDELWEARSAACWGDGATSADQARLDQLIAEAKETNRQNIQQLTLSVVLPRVSENATWQTVECTNVAKDDVADEVNFAGVWSSNLEADEAQEKTTFIKGRAQTVYGSTEALYFASTDQTQDATYFHRFAIGDDTLHSYFGSGAVTGYIYSSFAMSEHDGYFRIATTSGESWSWSDEDAVVSNNVYVVDAESTSLPVVGEVTGIAEGEKIYAVRFLGDVGYVVTFEQFDPLFVIDLSDPAAPVIRGELEMPGYSTYLHPLGDGYLIGFGEYVTEYDSGYGTFMEHDGLKLATFDVTNLSAPGLVQEMRIGSGWSKSEAFSNHLAFNFDAETGVLALPVEIYDNTETGDWLGEFQYYGVHLYDISDTGSINTKAEIRLEDGACQPARTVILRDSEESALYVLTPNALSVYDMENYELLDNATLSGEDSCYGYDDVVMTM
ncbi:MAG: hypothetical protein ACD_62C00117G0001 [uncultured bacterium]|nr:MAG: hypothetical protein ACD_62C00117G0001 [uncultured bacterium]